MFYNLPKAQFEGQEIYWEYSPLRWVHPPSTNDITQCRIVVLLKAVYLKGYKDLKWRDQDGVFRG